MTRTPPELRTIEPRHVGHTCGKLRDTSEMRQLWCGPLKNVVIAERMGVSTATLANFAQACGYGKRADARALGRVACHATPPEDQENVLTLPPRGEDEPRHPFWTEERDLEVLRTGGACRAVTALADELGKPTAFVWQRWHRLRAELREAG